MSGKVAALGLGTRLADPVSVWPVTTVIEIVPDVARVLGEHPEEAVRHAIAEQAGVSDDQIEPIGVTVTEHGTALVTIARDSNAERALSVAARRRATNLAEALHAAVAHSS